MQSHPLLKVTLVKDLFYLVQS